MLEVIYVLMLSFLFDTIIWNIEVPYRQYLGDSVRTLTAGVSSSDGEDLYIGVVGLMILILVFEWVRRKRLNSNRPVFEKYFYIPAIFFVFLLGVTIARFLLINY